MAQVTPEQATSTSAGPAPNGSIEDQIAAVDRQLKETQHQLAQLTAKKSAQAAFEQEWKTSTDALKTAQDKVPGAEEQASELLEQAADVKDSLSPVTVKAINDAVDAADQETGDLRNRVAEQAAKVAQLTADETTAKASTQNARAASADTKRMLAERIRAIELEITRMNRLVTDAKTAISQKQHRDAYLLIRDLQNAQQRLTALNDAGELDQLKQRVRDAANAEIGAAESERAVSWNLTKAKEQLQAEQTALTAKEASRRKQLDEAVKAAGGEASGTGGEPGRSSESGSPTTQPASPAGETRDQPEITEYQ